MRKRLAVTLAILVAAVASLPAKGATTRIRITGPTLIRPVDITDPGVLSTFNVFSWPETKPEGFIIQRSNQSLPAPPKTWHPYRVEFFIEQKATPAYVVTYQFDPAAATGFVFVPRTALNSNTIERNGMEDSWFHASQEWERVARPAIANAEKH